MQRARVEAGLFFNVIEKLDGVDGFDVNIVSIDAVTSKKSNKSAAFKIAVGLDELNLDVGLRLALSQNKSGRRGCEGEGRG
jgi:hypothetical protein